MAYSHGQICIYHMMTKAFGSDKEKDVESPFTIVLNCNRSSHIEETHHAIHI